MDNRKGISEDLKQAVANVALKDYCLHKLGLLYKTHSAVHYIPNKFKNTGSMKNVPRKPKRRMLSAREERYLVNKILKNPRLSAPKL